MTSKMLPRPRLGAQAQTSKLGDLFAALSNAQGEFPEIPRRRTAHVKLKAGGGYSYNYADLADVIRATAPALSAHGIAVMQWPDGGEIVTRIAHSGGAYMDTRWPIKPMPARGLDDAQSFQSAVQVAKRYAMQAALGISSEETLEGDYSQARGDAAAMDDNFRTSDGVRMPRGATWDTSKSKDENARAACDAIIEQFREPKTKEGVNGVWNRNNMFIAKFETAYPHLHADILDAFHEQMEARER